MGCFFFQFQAYSQEITRNDTLKISEKAVNHSPKKAAIMSAILPGLGQAYNKKYWKIPIIYAGFAGLGYAIKFNNDNFQLYKKAYVYRVDNNPETVDAFVGRYTDEDLNTLQSYYHRYRDLSLIVCSGLYILNIIDATVDAHLFNFDVSDDLSISVQPSPFTASLPGSQPMCGIKLKFNLR